MSDQLKTARLLALAVLGFVLFNYPLLAVFDVDLLVAGVPVLWAYLFLVWTIFIALVAWIVRS
ncbi:MAG TPA: hypothetical protein VFH23_16320 [Jiangellaceae bacterium]|nr:hypothetical protein [Jiangellaceae bacterium]